MGPEAAPEIHNGILCSHEKERKFAICSRVGRLKVIMVCEISQTAKDHYMKSNISNSVSITPKSSYRLRIQREERGQPVEREGVGARGSSE